jgi:GNAT superfamily N-acetyltransferase
MKAPHPDKRLVHEAPRRANLDDMAAVAKIHRLAFFRTMPHVPVLHTPDEDLAYYSTVVFSGAEIWLSEQGGIIAGFIAFRPGWVDHLYVHPDFQGRGIGSGLLEWAKVSADSLRLWTFQCNVGARRFYERHGFQVEEETDGSRNEERQPDVLYFWKPSGASAMNSPRVDFRLRVRPATADDTELVSSVLIEAAAWLRVRGMEMWRAEELHADRIAADVASGQFFLAECDGEAAGTIEFQLADELFWPDVAGDDAAYVHRLAVRRAFAGGLLSSALLQWAADRARSLGRQYLRLDCEASRPRLRAIYERSGFRHHSDRQVGPYFVARYELALT